MGNLGAVVLFVAALVAAGTTARAQQSFEVAPFGGYGFGGGFYELSAREPVDLDGANSFGLVLNFPFRDDLQIEGFFTHQEARFTTPGSFNAPLTNWKVTIDHVQAGGLRELSGGRARPFLTGTLGLTRYESGGDNEVRFAVGAGGGVKLFLIDNLGLRLDGRLLVTFVDADVDFLACAPGVCVGSFDAIAVWQTAFTAGATVRF